MKFEPTYVFGFITVLFMLLTAAKTVAKKTFCTLCGSVSLTWLALLGASYAGLLEDKILLAILIGGSTVGILHMVEKRVPEKFLLFRLPFFITLVAMAYTAVAPSKFNINILVIPGALWFVLWIFHLYKNNKTISGAVRALIECCKNW